ncbi:MAG: roadblock/LC7 domain-containing protein [Thermodesulfobacteriota bacterium]|nr:roadblock/LC7 domain-containing protein [Thermodesulfobacteriota bacterium]
MEYSFTPEQLDRIETILAEDLIEVGANSVIFIDMAGNIIARCDNGESDHDVYSLAALGAGNFGAVNAMANIIGEDEFSLLFHKGQEKSMHFSKVNGDFLLIILFGKDISLGFLRLKVAEAANKLRDVWEH